MWFLEEFLAAFAGNIDPSPAKAMLFHDLWVSK
jgi:hypothetical protein